MIVLELDVMRVSRVVKLAIGRNVARPATLVRRRVGASDSRRVVVRATNDAVATLLVAVVVVVLVIVVVVSRRDTLA